MGMLLGLIPLGAMLVTNISGAPPKMDFERAKNAHAVALICGTAYAWAAGQADQRGDVQAKKQYLFKSDTASRSLLIFGKYLGMTDSEIRKESHEAPDYFLRQDAIAYRDGKTSFSAKQLKWCKQP